jgi:hypothetical protein
VDFKQEFIKSVIEHFQQITPPLDSELTAVLHRTYPKVVKFLLVEYDSAHFSEDFSVSMWPMDSHGKPVGDSHRFLKGKAMVAPPEIYEAEKYEEIEPWETASELLECWLIERWSRIEKVRQHYPAFIGHHDSYFKKDLLTGEEINWDEILEGVQVRGS